MTESKTWSCEYIDQFGKLCAIHILGSLEEVTHHADALGLSEPQKVVAIVPEFEDWSH